MPTLDIKPRAEAEPELNLLFPRTSSKIPCGNPWGEISAISSSPKKQAPLVLTSQPVEMKEIVDYSLWRSLLHNIDDFLFPRKQPPLVLTSKPIPVKDIWGFYDYKKNGALGSTVAHVVVVAIIIGATIVRAKNRASDRHTPRSDHAGFAR